MAFDLMPEPQAGRNPDDTAAPHAIRRTFNPGERKAIRRLFGATCAECGAEAQDGHADHVQPFAAGGPTDLGNAQWLCAPCNLAKGAATPTAPKRGFARFVMPKPDASGFKLRRWQRRFLARFRAAVATGRTSFFLGAGVGSGKTIAALIAFLRSDFDLLVVITPKTGIRGSWQEDAAKLGITLQTVVAGSTFDGTSYRIPHGYVLTTQMLPSVINDLRIRCAHLRVLVVVDEAHHFGEGQAWTDSADAALGRAAFRLSMSGTPFRTDERRIAGLTYQREGAVGVANPDFAHSYEDAFADGLVAPVVCRFIGGSVEKRLTDGRGFTYDFADGDYSGRTGKPDRERMAVRLRLAATESLDYQKAAFREADRALEEYRRDGRPWGGLIVCATIPQAQAVHAYIARELRQPALLLVEHADTEEGVARFNADPSLRWVVSITKVSEGISIPRLRVALMLSHVTARQTLEQIRGRLARLLDGCAQLQQEAMFFLFADPRNVSFARRSNKMLLHVVPWLAAPEREGDPGDHDERMARLREGGIEHPEQDDAGDADAVRRLRDRLGDERQYDAVNLGRYTLFARPAMDGAVIGGEIVTEDEYLGLRQRLAEVIDPLTAMEASGPLITRLRRIVSGDVT
jgi:superfamily II DNA or RNA helicase